MTRVQYRFWQHQLRSARWAGAPRQAAFANWMLFKIELARKAVTL